MFLNDCDSNFNKYNKSNAFLFLKEKPLGAEHSIYRNATSPGPFQCFQHRRNIENHLSYFIYAKLIILII